MSKKLAIMSKPSIGLRDTNYPVMWFGVKFGETLSSGALIVLDWQQAKDLIADNNVTDIDNLDGHPCQIEETDGIVKFIEVLNV